MISIPKLPLETDCMDTVTAFSLYQGSGWKKTRKMPVMQKIMRLAHMPKPVREGVCFLLPNG
jgi:hypothetical protein